ncbi:MAG: hypothetical protein KF850_33070 [Labilithrix sp.]|nr:hypothetical protein [Labilithrix sp.]
MKEEHRQYGTIESVRTGDEDGRWETTWLFVKFGGSVQGFGGYFLKEHREKWNAELCALFGVSKLDELVGKRCWALRCFSGWNEPIEGLENAEGQRFVATDFFRRHLSKPVESVIAKRRESIESSIASLTRRINDETRILARLESDYVEWATVLSGAGQEGKART